MFHHPVNPAIVPFQFLGWFCWEEDGEKERERQRKKGSSWFKSIT